MAQTAPEPKLALLIGNAAYKSSPLRNPVNDVRLMEVVLKESGFTVMKAENASMREMRRLVREFGDKLKAEGGVGLFYFAGHGVQVRGDNYLVSIDSDIRNEDEVPDDALNGNLVLEKMQSAGNRVNILILDACRNNPFTVKSRGSSSGLAGMQAPGGSLVAYATAPGAVAADGSGRNSPYTANLARAIRQPGLPIEEVFKQVRTAVRRETGNQQTPWENTALEGQFFFKAAMPLANGQSGQLADPLMLDLAFWESVKNSPYMSEVQTYLANYPNGTFALLAKARVEELRKAGTPQQAQPVAIGTLLLTDKAYGKKTSLAVVVTEKTHERTAYSSGDIVEKGGKVVQVRIGDVVVRRMSGELWTLPLKIGASGEAAIERVDAGYKAPGTLSWKAVDLGGGKLGIDAKVSYFVRWNNVYDGLVYGVWSATYHAGGDLPDVSASMLEGPMASRNIVSAEFRVH